MPSYTGCVYIAINRVNGRAYVGKTVGKLFNRKATHRFASKRRGGAFYSAIRKYGWRSFIWRKVFCSDDEQVLFEAEKALIVDFRAAGVRLYNIGAGGEGQQMPCTEDRRQKVSATMKGRVFSEEHRRNLSRAIRGRALSTEHVEAIRRGKAGQEAPSLVGRTPSKNGGGVGALEVRRSRTQSRSLRCEALVERLNSFRAGLLRPAAHLC